MQARIPKHQATVNPTEYLPDEERMSFLQKVEDYDLSMSYEVYFLRRRMKWMATLPAVVWTLDPQMLASFDASTEQVLRDPLIYERKNKGYLGFSKTRDIIYKHSRFYYRANAIASLKPSLKVPELAEAIMRVMTLAEDRNQLVIRARVVPSKDYVRDPNARVRGDGRRHRGPMWTAAEDAVLRKWFAKHAIGPYAGTWGPLTDAQWTMVLKALDGRRAKTEVRRRLGVLNAALKAMLMVDGFIPRVNVQRYVNEALGEHPPRIPTYRPRIKGRSYYGNFPARPA